ncbi:MAG TPA: S46 family peptidase [Terriglobales bacterium]|jgi:hypothetical protein|nr:S46 family peptidase [Terriglobales bacterium]
MQSFSRYFLISALLLLASAAVADEGMWTFDNPPRKLLQERYGFTPTPQWLEHVRLSSVRLNDGGSGSFVSPHGLLLTNHHVAIGQLQKNSTAEHDYVRNGFYAATPDQEMKSPDLEVNVLVSMEDVTQRVQSAVQGITDPQKALAARRDVIAQITREGEQKTGLRSDVVTLYQGGEYWLYRYKKYTDVRIVFAPEQQIAYYGGDPDNFTYPRYDLDMTLLRVYENGKPLESTNYLKWNAKGAANGELVLVSGHPGTTLRLDTMAQILRERDVRLPLLQTWLRKRLEVLRQYSAKGREQARQSEALSLSLENAVKAYRGTYQALLDKQVIAKKQAEEDEFRKLVASRPEWQSEFGGAWDAIAAAEAKAAPMTGKQIFRRLDSQLASLALSLVQFVAEIKKPDGERLPGFHEAQLESLRYRLLSPAPIYPELEKARVSGGLAESARQLGADDEFVKTVLAGHTPDAVATDVIGGTHLADPKVRKALLEGGEAAVAASDDPMIALARKIDPLSRALTKWFEDNVQSVEQAAGEKLGKARFLAYGKSAYPDATFTLRLSYGTLKGYPMNGTKAPYKTTFYGLYDRAHSFDLAPPFDLPARYREGIGKLDLATPFDFVSTCDVVGGNSGSPVINRNAELVGLIFDGNIESLAGDFIYDEETNRAVAVHSAAMIEALRKLYGAGKLADELEGVGH